VQRAGEAGFTLLEALVAVLIVGLAAVAALETVAAELRTAARAKHAFTATALAEYRLETLRVLPAAELHSLPDSLARGAFQPPFERYRWTASVREVGGESGLHEAQVAVLWDRGAFRIATRLYRPELLVRR
jgi:prepilin-type N-terminal cleavage/methylation domain-containing protein